MLSKLKNLIQVFNSADSLSNSIQELKECLDNSDLIQTKRRMQKEINLRNAALDNLDDMIWAKDLDGKYLMINEAFRVKFCYGLPTKDVIGKTDIELSRVFKEKVGKEHHTFGEMCFNSDLIVKELEEPKKFLESGMINGKMMKLVVNKSPFRDFRGRMFAICGSGRDVTEWHNDLENAIKSSNACFGKEGMDLLLKELNKLEFKNQDKGQG